MRLFTATVRAIPGVAIAQTSNRGVGKVQHPARIARIRTRMPRQAVSLTPHYHDASLDLLNPAFVSQSHPPAADQSAWWLF